MNYEKIYNEIIENAIKLNRKRNQGIYLEEHHILPRCKDGTNDKNNLVMLTAREHFLCHKLLHKMFPHDSKLYFAYRAMTAFDVTGNRGISAREFEYTKKLFAKFISLNNSGRVFTEEHLQKLRDNNPNIGGLTEEHKKAISDALMGRTLSPEHIAACSAGLKKLYETRPGPRLGILHTEEAKEKNRQSTLEYWASRTPEEMRAWSEKFSGENNANFGKKRPEEFCKKMSEVNSLKIVYDGVEYLSTNHLCESLGIPRSTLSKKLPKLIKENPEKYYYIDPEGKRDKPRKKTQVNNKRILFDGIEYESVAACSRVIGKSDVRVGQILREQIKKNNSNYSYLT
jgi:hypothetical protein